MEIELLDRVLASTAITSDVFFAGAPCGEWRMSNADSPGIGAAFHLVLEGSAWMHLQGGSSGPRRLDRGDFAFLPRNALHSLTYSNAAPPALDTHIESPQDADESRERTVVVCGKLQLEADAQRFLLAPLPELVVLPAGDAAAAPIAPVIVTTMWREVRGPAPALSVTLNKLADVLVVEVLRFAVRGNLATSGLFAGLADAHLRRALADIVEQPGGHWTVETLAQRAAMSRSNFATRFQQVVGTSPLNFIREWRMRRAQMLLREGRSVASVAALVGYDSEVAFAKAFKRVIGVGPGAVRRR
ncbi:MAG: AraC family transcriptional regulator [Steroidobacteraceae bacterium]